MKLVLDDTFFFRRVHILTFNFHCNILTHEIGKLKKSKQSIGFSTMIDVADITSCSQCRYMLCGVPNICGYIQTKSRVIRHRPTIHDPSCVSKTLANTIVFAPSDLKGKQKKPAQRHLR